MPDDARRALLTGLFDHAPTFPPASLPPEEALAEDRRARESEHAWILGRLIWPQSRLEDLDPDDDRVLGIVAANIERHHDMTFLEGVDLDEVASQGLRAKIRCGGERVPSGAELAAFVRGCRERGIVFKATAGLHHAYPADGEHGFLNLLAAAVFGDEEEALSAPAGSFELDAESFRWGGREALPGQLADTRTTLLHSIGSCSFFEPVGELEGLGMLA